ncbi:MAG TPA: ABC transporter ATP-binding protein [bacterium]|nr:ABC transporter ATP-binding protein [bacterium]
MKTYTRLFCYIKPYWPQLAVATVCMVLFALFNTVTIYTIKPIIDHVFTPGGEIVTYPLPLTGVVLTLTRHQMLFGIAGFLILTFLCKGLASYGQAYFMGSCGMRAGTDLRNAVYDHLLGQSLAYFDRRKTGDLVSRLTGDIGIILNSISNIVAAFIREPAEVIFVIGLIFLLDWRLTLVSLLVFPLVGWVIAFFGKSMRVTTRSMQQEQGEISTVIMESVAGIRIVQGFTMEAYEQGRHRARAAAFLAAALRILRIKALAPPVLELIAALAIAGIIVYGGLQVIKGEQAGGITTGTFFTFMAALITLYKPLRSLTQVNNTLQQIVAAGERLFEILDAPAAVASRPDAPSLPPFAGMIEYRGVHFAYDDEPVLRGIDLTITRGMRVAVVGSSGAGKTTLINLLPRFYDPTRGQVLIDGEDIRLVGLDSLRRQIGIVTQEVVLFNDTVRHNVAYGTANATDEQIMAAARAANAAEFIAKLPEGLDTVIGERGMTLSGGERQRLSIARAILKNPPILLLDEATSNLDTESERAVQEALERLMAQRTTLVIAHRLSTVTTADLIIVLDGGRIVDRGKHEELLARGGLYQRLYELQFADLTGAE